MNNYFTDVYLKRMNKDGTNIQERTKARKEREFDTLFLKKTKYQAFVYQINDESANFYCSVQPSTWRQDKIVSNILISTKEQKLKTGDIIRTYQKTKDTENDNCWLICFCSPDTTKGYSLYEAVELDEVLNYTDEYGDTVNVFPVKFVNETSTFVQDKFSSYGSVSYREPLAHRKFIAKDADYLKKGTYFSFKNRGWEISGVDNLSIDGVAYVSIEEFLQREPEPITSKDILVGEDTNFFLNNT